MLISKARQGLPCLVLDPPRFLFLPVIPQFGTAGLLSAADAAQGQRPQRCLPERLATAAASPGSPDSQSHGPRTGLHFVSSALFCPQNLSEPPSLAAVGIVRLDPLPTP